ncbi:MAG: hypothetical protein KKI09_03145 [Spirochaetes bacterium]|nr:hypothetical protein [Spirochaetota bacterium]MBU0954402.1 hypothetical protein [Spirochaetota bacterium]
MSEFFEKEAVSAERQQKLKSIVEALAGGASISSVKKDFHQLIKSADAVEVAAWSKR